MCRCLCRCLCRSLCRAVVLGSSCRRSWAGNGSVALSAAHGAGGVSAATGGVAVRRVSEAGGVQGCPLWVLLWVRSAGGCRWLHVNTLLGQGRPPGSY